MPGHGKMSSIIMRLYGYRLQLPIAATAKYEALTELTIIMASFDEEELGGVRSLGDFVSSCCPRLRKLEIKYPKGLGQLVLRTEALGELNLYFTKDLRTLEVMAPNLSVLKLVNCFDVSVVKVSANRLEEVGVQQLDAELELDIHADLTSVRCLGPISVYMHGQHYGPDRSGGLWLLENCPGAENVKVSLEHWEASNVTDVELIDLMSSEGAPLTFTNVRRMEVTVRVHQFPEGHLIAKLFLEVGLLMQ
ncbi:hypothetical protein QOZ80_3AG0239240 [Eleusine coracana subsp. coracana]|nr:hypothetical protein QOZ80_3AG0239240 [Eleusine coracana subsp. coracana]